MVSAILPLTLHSRADAQLQALLVVHTRHVIPVGFFLAAHNSVSTANFKKHAPALKSAS